MRTHMTEDEHQVVLDPAGGNASASVVWLHGLGADGHDFVPLVPELNLPQQARVRFVFPHARVRPVTINGGHAMRAWYDIRDLTPEGRDDEQGFAEARDRVEAILAAEHARGIPASRVVLAGFSQGGAVALHAGLRHASSLAGILALSCYLPLRAKLAAQIADANRTTPILMCHGSEDAVVLPHFGELSRDAMRALGLPVEWRSYRMAHGLCGPQVSDIADWLRAHGFECEQVNKVAEGRPHIVDLIKNGEISYIINSTEGKQAIADSFSIRRQALQHHVTYSTTVAGARALVGALDHYGRGSVHSLQELHRKL